MRLLLAVVVMVVACNDAADTIDVETACYEQSVARCEWMDGCFNGEPEPGCVEFFTGWCVDRTPEPVPAEEHEACMESLETAGCGIVYPFTQECDGTDHD